MKHKHSEKMMEYAQDAMETDKPWERWECLHGEDTEWFGFDYHPEWKPNIKYRRKPRTININGHEVPEPVREPLENAMVYYMPKLSDLYPWSSTTWDNDSNDNQWLKRGLIHLTKEAAIAHAKALLSFTEKQL